MNDQLDDSISTSEVNGTEISKNQSQQYASLTTNQLFSSLFITEDGEIFLGTKFWFSIYYFTEKMFNAKRHISIGSKINCIDSKIYKNNNELRYIALATSDGFINFLKIKYINGEQFSIEIVEHNRISIFSGEAKFVSIIDENTIVSAGDNSIISFITKNASWKHVQYQRKKNITALKYFQDQIYVGYENGDVDIFTSSMELKVKPLHFECAILNFYYSDFLIIVTQKNYYELDQKLIEKRNMSFDFDADNVFIAFDRSENQAIQKMLVSNSNQVEYYENNTLTPIFDIPSNEHALMSFLGDALIVISSKTISLYYPKKNDNQ